MSTTSLTSFITPEPSFVYFKLAMRSFIVMSVILLGLLSGSAILMDYSSLILYLLFYFDTEEDGYYYYGD